MILDNENTDFPTDSEVLNRMGESPFKFYLTGSRFMRLGQRPDSDWDFMTQDSPEVREFLKSIHFADYNILNYAGKDGNGGTLCNAVWQRVDNGTFEEPDVVWAFGLTIQVQLVPDVTRKLFVRDTIARSTLAEFHAGVRGPDRTELWELIGRQFPVEL